MIDFSKIDLVIFDLDGTLIDSARDLAIALNLALIQEGLPGYTEEELIRRIGVGSKNLLRELVNDDPHAEQRVFQYYIKHYADGMLANTRLFPRVEEVLNQLNTKTVALLSNKREEPCRRILKHFKIDHHFKMILGGDSLPKRKPDPEPILHICRELGIEPERTLMIGDSPVDLEAGEKAGTKTVGLLKGLTPEEEMKKSKAHIFLQEVSELLDLLETLTAQK